LRETFERYLQDKGKGRGGEGGNYRRNVARELDRFEGWAAGNPGSDWTGITPPDSNREPTAGNPATSRPGAPNSATR
jgi:hypothetical protein